MTYDLDFESGEYLLTGNTFDFDQSDRPIQCYADWIDIERAEEVTGESDEDTLNRMILRVGSLIDTYLARDIRDCTHTDRWSKFAVGNLPEPMLFLKNWPILEVHSIRFDGERYPLDQFQFDADYGIVVLPPNTANSLINIDRNVTINYRAGYNPTPPEIAQVFEEVLVTLNQAGGSGSLGEVRKASLVGLGSVEFATSNTYSGVDQQLGVPEILKPYTGTLDHYKSDRKMGVVI